LLQAKKTLDMRSQGSGSGKGEIVKYVKILGLAAIAAATMIATLGAETASGTALCEDSQTTNCTSHVALGTSVRFSAEESIKLLGPFGLIIDTCTESNVEGPTTSPGGSAGVAVSGEVKVLTFAKCTRTTTVGTKSTLSVQNIAGTDNGTVTSSGATVTVHEIPGFGTCSFVTENTSIGTLTGSLTTPTFDISATIPSETSGCPSGTWSGKYVYSGSTPFIVASTTSGNATLCENNQTTSCTNHVAVGTTLKFSAEETIKLQGPFNLIIDTCTVSTVEGPTTSTGSSTEPVRGVANVLTFENCTRPTTVGTEDTLSVQNIAGTDNGTVTSSGATVTVHEVPGFGTCSFLTNNTDIGTLTGSTTTPTFDISATIPSETKGCPNGTWSGKYVYSGSTPFIVSAS
jgi:hypothetical protein